MHDPVLSHKLEYTFPNNRWLTAEEIDNKEELNRNALVFIYSGTI